MVLTALASAATMKQVSHSGFVGVGRSEEHTSELQSQSNLVCRLLLEKKKKHYQLHSTHKNHSNLQPEPLFDQEPHDPQVSALETLPPGQLAPQHTAAYRATTHSANS